MTEETVMYGDIDKTEELVIPENESEENDRSISITLGYPWSEDTPGLIYDSLNNRGVVE